MTYNANKAVGKVLNSTKCFYDLMDNYLLPAHERCEEITISIEYRSKRTKVLCVMLMDKYLTPARKRGEKVFITVK